MVAQDAHQCWVSFKNMVHTLWMMVKQHLERIHTHGTERPMSYMLNLQVVSDTLPVMHPRRIAHLMIPTMLQTTWKQFLPGSKNILNTNNTISISQVSHTLASTSHSSLTKLISTTPMPLQNSSQTSKDSWLEMVLQIGPMILSLLTSKWLIGILFMIPTLINK